MKETKKVIYVSPDYCGLRIDFENLQQEGKYQIAKENECMEIFTVEEFADAFNDGLISDEGFIYVVNL